jgi:hypothetical protein
MNVNAGSEVNDTLLKLWISTSAPLAHNEYSINENQAERIESL